MPGSKSKNAIIQVHALIIGATSSNLGTIAVDASAAISQRIQSIADDFALYKYKRLSCRLHVNGVTDFSVGFVGNIPVNTPASHADNMNSLDATFCPAGQLVPSDWVTVPPKRLAGQFPWYRTRLGTFDQSEAIVGALYIVSSSSAATYTLEVRCAVEFKDPLDPDVSAEARVLRSKAREIAEKLIRDKERDRLLGLLAPTGTGSAPQVRVPGTK